MIATIAIQVAQTDWGDHMDGGWWVAMVLGMVLITALVLLGAVLVVRELMSRGRAERSEEPDDAMALLDRRFAAGEISPEEYRERRAVLRE